MTTLQIQPIIRIVKQWTNLIQDPGAVHIPQALDYLLLILLNCVYIVTNLNMMQAKVLEKQATNTELQQVFLTCKNSHLVHIRSCDPEPDEPPTPTAHHQQIAAEIKARAADDEQQAARQTVESETLHDTNPWLRMTRWARYLAGVHFQDVVDVVATPDREQEDPVSQATQRVWDAMLQLARRCQRTVQHCGNGIRMTAASTMPNQIPQQPLRAYMDETSIQKHAQPWQQILLFVIRTQTDWPWRQKKPQYVMTARQQKTWQRLWQLARQPAADQAGDALASRGSPDPMAPELDHSRIEAFVMTPLETACLEFCIELLNQKTKVHEYESTLVCAMAVLGRGEQGWRDPNSYPPIISRVLKGSWTGEAADQELGWLAEDEGYPEGPDTRSSSPSSPPSSNETVPSASQGSAIGRIPRSRMPFQAGVDWMVQRFMVRGQHGPVEVLLDWRTYGLKIHYNTTAPGHVTWMGQERLLYKQMDFTMGQFRSFVHGVVGAAQESRAMAGHPMALLVRQPH
ncbi:hypothetical protein BDV11DRAFT_215147 [Aspergillus similis]